MSNAKFNFFFRFELSQMVVGIYHFKVRIGLQKPTAYNRSGTVIITKINKKLLIILIIKFNLYSYSGIRLNVTALFSLALAVFSGNGGQVTEN